MFIQRNGWLPTQQQLQGIFFCSVVRNNYLSAQQQLSGRFFCPLVMPNSLSVQWWLSVDCLLTAGQVLNCSTCGGGFRIWTSIWPSLPMEVGMETQLYIMPVVSKLTMWLVLTLRKSSSRGHHLVLDGQWWP